jgi:S-adenosylmethionine-diacylglycerol 3-amino-3-carboxypropyl transferase
MKTSEAAIHADFSEIRYAQCWEDADILVKGLNVQPGDTCLSISSAGDNSLALLAEGAGRVIALDLNPAQLMCLELRIAAYRELSHPELLELMGSRTSSRRRELYNRCRPLLSSNTLRFWDAHATEVDAGIGGAGKFERYFSLFRRRILPLIHHRQTIENLLSERDREDRHLFYDKHWNNWRWRLLFKLFFSKTVMGRLGRDPSFFRYVEGSVSDKILIRTRHALTELNPTDNPYLGWILTGQHNSSLPRALRPEHFDTIREGLDRIEFHQVPLEQFLEQEGRNRIDRYNLSDIFEYMSDENYHNLLERICDTGRSGGRLAYWNMLAPRKRPESMKDALNPLVKESAHLFQQDKAFFYSAFILEEIC